MNNKQRELIADAYKQHVLNGLHSDPAGAYGDIRDFFQELRGTDKKLDQEMQERFDEIPEKI